MPTWSGWQNQLLTAAHLPTSAANRNFLTDWNNHAESNCGNNPIDISHVLSGSSNCALLPGTTLHAQKYTSHAQAATAFNDQLHSGKYPSLLKALQASDPYTKTDNLGVELDLLTWGAAKFNTFYGAKTAPIKVTTVGPGLHGGWSHLRRVVNHGLPSSLHSSDKSIRAALRNLSKARKVRL